MTIVLGIDAAWTKTQPSGVALLDARSPRPKLLAVVPSYDNFVRCARGDAVSWASCKGELPPLARVMTAATELARSPVSIVAVDMPMSLDQFESRRAADDAVSKAFGAAKCGTHSPSKDRPGEISRLYTSELGKMGYTLATTVEQPERVLLEVYPHLALLRLCGRNERLPYKASKTRIYWRGITSAIRTDLLLEIWRCIHQELGKRIDGVDEMLPIPQLRSPISSSSLKPYEDALDAIICAWTGLCYAQGMAEPYGDARAAIWAPLP